MEETLATLKMEEVDLINRPEIISSQILDKILKVKGYIKKNKEKL